MTSTIAKDLEPLIVPISDLETWEGNPHKGDKSAIKLSYETFGQERPLVYWHDVDGEMNNDPGANVVIDGNHQLMVARDELNWTEIAASEFVGTYEQALAYALAANRIAELGSNDTLEISEALNRIENQELVGVTGYSQEEIDKMILDLPDFDPLGGGVSAVRLDEKEPIICPECGHEWTK